jgi:hypothetical protein
LVHGLDQLQHHDHLGFFQADDQHRTPRLLDEAFHRLLQLFDLGSHAVAKAG